VVNGKYLPKKSGPGKRKYRPSLHPHPQSSRRGFRFCCRPARALEAWAFSPSPRMGKHPANKLCARFKQVRLGNPVSSFQGTPATVILLELKFSFTTNCQLETLLGTAASRFPETSTTLTESSLSKALAGMSVSAKDRRPTIPVVFPGHRARLEVLRAAGYEFHRVFVKIVSLFVRVLRLRGSAFGLAPPGQPSAAQAGPAPPMARQQHDHRFCRA